MGVSHCSYEIILLSQHQIDFNKYLIVEIYDCVKSVFQITNEICLCMNKYELSMKLLMSEPISEILDV